MSLLAILRTILRHKVATMPIVLLTLVGVGYVVAFTTPVYEAKASYAFINPPGPPSPAEVARDPNLANIQADNPYTRFADQSVVVDILVRKVVSGQVRRELLKEGADPRYDVIPSRQFGSSPIAEVTGVGATAAIAETTARTVSEALRYQLKALQAAEGVAPRYMIRALEVEGPEGARLRVASRVRSLVAVLGLGTVVLFVMVSITEAFDIKRAERLDQVGGPELNDTTGRSPRGRRRGRPSVAQDREAGDDGDGLGPGVGTPETEAETPPAPAGARAGQPDRRSAAPAAWLPGSDGEEEAETSPAPEQSPGRQRSTDSTEGKAPVE